MADSIIELDAKSNLGTIVQQLKDVNKERDKLIQSRDRGTTTEKKFVEEIVRLRKVENGLLKQKLELESLSAVNQDKANKAQAATQMAINRQQKKSLDELRKKQEAILKWGDEYRKKYQSIPAEKQVEFTGTPKKSQYIDSDFVSQLKQQYALKDAIESTKERTNINAIKSYYDTEEKRIKENTNLIRQQMETRARLQMKQEYASKDAIESAKGRTNIEAIKSYYNTEEKRIKENSSLIRQQMETRAKQQNALKDAIESTKERTNVEAIKSYYDTEEKRIKENSNLIRQQMETRARLQNTPTLSFAQQLSNLNKLQERHWQMWKNTGSEVSKIKYDAVGIAIEKITNKQNEYNKVLNKSTGYLGSFAQKFRSHTNWIASGAIIGTLVAIPMAIENTVRETEVLGLKIKQNLELVEKYAKDHHALDADIKHLTEVAGVFATGYGANIKDVMEMMQILSRRFKSPEELTYYTNLAMIMHKLDFVAPKQAAENLESVILSMGLSFEQAKQFVNEFSVAVHVSRITGSDLLSALQRSGATFKNMNMNTAESIAMISTLSTVVAKSGQNIGISLNSLLTNIDFKKAAKALHEYKVEVYGDTGKMRQGVEIWRDIAKVFNGLLAAGDEKRANEFALAMSGGKFRINDLKAIVGSWHEFEQILNEIQTKASSDMTTTLLQTSLQSYENILIQLQARLQVFGVIIGNELLPMLKGMVNGLSDGVRWLNDNREAVAEVINVIGKLSQALILYKGYQFIANTQLGDFLKSSTIMARNAPTFIGSIGSMGRSIFGFALTLGSAIARMSAFYVLAEALNRLASGASQDLAEKKFLASIAGVGSNDAGAGKRRLTDDEQELLDAINDRNKFLNENRQGGIIDHITEAATGGAFFDSLKTQAMFDEKDQKVRDGLIKIKQKSSLSDVDKMVAEAEKGLRNKTHINPYDLVKGMDFNTGEKSGLSGGIDPSIATDNRMFRDSYTMVQKKMFHEAKLSADQYANSLELLSTKEAIYGTNVSSVTERLTTMNSRVTELQKDQHKYNNEAEYLGDILDQIIDKDEELKKSLESMGITWSTATKQQKRDFRELNTEFMENHKNIKTITKVLYEYENKASDVTKEIVKLTNEVQKLKFAGVFDPEKIFARQQKRIKDIQEQALAKVDKNKPLAYLEERAINLEATWQQLQVLQDREKYLEIELEKAKNNPTQWIKINDELRGLQTEIEKTTEALNKLKDKTYDIRVGFSEVFSDMLIQGQSARQIWNKLWNDMANDAIKALFRIQNSTPGLLTQIFGMFGGGGGGIPASPGFSYTVGPITPAHRNIGFNAMGSIGSQQQLSWIREGNKKEAIIPLEDHKERGKQLWLQSGMELGMIGKGNEYVPYLKNPQLAQQVTESKAQQSSEYINELRESNKLLRQQSQLLLALLNKETGGGVAVAQPIVMRQEMSEDELAGKIAKMRASGYSV